MTDICLTERADGIAVRASGHAAYAAPGQDIVCAGISALLLSALGFLKERAGEDGRCRVTETVRDGALSFFTEGFSDGADRVVCRLLRTGLCAIRDSYPLHTRVIYETIPPAHESDG